MQALIQQPKTHMVTPETSGQTTGRLKHLNPEELEEIYFKGVFMRMMKTFKGGMKNSLKEM